MVDNIPGGPASINDKDLLHCGMLTPVSINEPSSTGLPPPSTILPPVGFMFMTDESGVYITDEIAVYIVVGEY